MERPNLLHGAKVRMLQNFAFHYNSEAENGNRCRLLSSTSSFVNEAVYIVLRIHNYRSQQRHMQDGIAEAAL
jgi:hypothetical protein